jgi:hypothetical protein
MTNFSDGTCGMSETASDIRLNRIETRRWLDDRGFKAEVRARAVALIDAGAAQVKVVGHPAVTAGAGAVLTKLTRSGVKAQRGRRRRKRVRAREYPRDWPNIRAKILRRAKYRCEKCGAAQGEPHPVTHKPVVLQVSHRNHVKSDCRDENLRALCPRCHGLYDGSHMSDQYWASLGGES